jgi:hypothetical protein
MAWAVITKRRAAEQQQNHGPAAVANIRYPASHTRNIVSIPYDRP